MLNPVLIPIIASAGILLGGNGMLGTLVTVRANMEGFSATQIGLLGTGYFLGFMVGCFITPTMIRRAGHIRVFAGLAASGAICALGLILIVDPWLWILLRCLTGVAFCGTAMVVESWLNEIAAHGNRGRILSVYRIVDLSAVTGGQFLLPLIGAGTFEIFAVNAILFCAAVLPVSLSALSSPAPPENTRLRPRVMWAISPVASVGVVTVGLANGAFRAVGPLYAQRMGLGVDRVALFMSLGIFAGVVFQYPLGWLSDRVGRRTVLIIATLGAAAASMLLANSGVEMIYPGIFLFGGFAMPLYSLSVAHANDYAKPGQHLELSAGLILFFSIGAALGSLVVSVLINQFGPRAFFLYTSTIHLCFVVFVVYRITRRAAVPRELRGRFVALLRTSPLNLDLARGERLPVVVEEIPPDPLSKKREEGGS